MIGTFRVQAAPVGEMARSEHESSRPRGDELLRHALDQVPGAALLVFDRDLIFRAAAGAALRVHGFDPRSIEGRPVAGLLGSPRWSLYEDAYRDALRGRVSALEIPSPDGSSTFEVRVVPVRDAAGEVVGGVSVHLDMTRRGAYEAELRRSEAELRVILDSSPDVIFRLDRSGVVRFLNDTVRRLVGADTDGWIGRRWDEIVPVREGSTWVDQVESALASGTPASFEAQFGDDEAARWWDVHLVPSPSDDGAVAHLTVRASDVTDRLRAENALREAATHDPLTGLVNRAELSREIERAVSTSNRTGRPTGLLMLDLDRFKAVNDSFGHAAGDQLLIAASERIRAVVRAGDLAGRLGGDEFVVVMRDLPEPTEAASVAERLVEAFRQPLTLGALALTTTASVGLTVAAPSATPHPDELLAEADVAMYAAKGAGRDRLWLYSEDLRAVVAERHRIEADLHHALDRGELELWYQPEIDLGTGRIRAAEALLRWRHPSGELLAAERFVSVADDSGLILGIGAWTIEEAARQAGEWAVLRPDDPPVVRVNLSASQLGDTELLPVLERSIASAGIPPALLCVEVTEESLLGEGAGTLDVLRRVRELGVGVAVDAFGAGDVSLALLRDHPVDVLKLDRSFVTTLVEEEGDRRLVAGILALAGELDLPVTAKAVENEGQLSTLRRLGCRTAQGWLLSPAIEGDRIRSLLRAEADR